MTDRPDVKRSPARRVVLILLTAFTAWHIFATFLWIAPPSGLRQLIPGDLLRSYMMPMFGQSWSVFAPEPINGDYRLRVRSVVIQDGTERTSDWVDATAAELAMADHHLFPPRAAVLSSEVASTYKGAYDDLSSRHHEAIEQDRVGNGSLRELRAELIERGSRAQVVDYLEAERTATAYATQVAYAVWPGQLVRVQFEVSRQNVIPFARRNDPDAVRPPAKIAESGWRTPVERPGQSREAFAATFRQGLQESGQ